MYFQFSLKISKCEPIVYKDRWHGNLCEGAVAVWHVPGGWVHAERITATVRSLKELNSPLTPDATSSTLNFVHL